MSLSIALLAAVTLSGTTTHPVDSCFARGERAEAVFSAEGLVAGALSEMKLSVADAFGKVVESRSVAVNADGEGRWKGNVPLPSDRYGAFRVSAELEGVRLPRCGTRGEGYLTYAVLPDPEKRPYLEPEDAFVGLHGTGPGQTRWLGARWSLQRRWPMGTDREFREFMAERNASSWTNHYFITASRIFQCPGCFSAAGLNWLKTHAKNPGGYASFWDLVASDEGCGYLAEAYRNLAHRACHEEDFGQRLHVYEVFWEPELHYPNRALMLKAAKIAWDNITSVDTNALVAAPTMHAMGFLDEHRDLFEKGLGEHMNAFSVHPYGMPAEEKNLRTIRLLRRMAQDYTGKDLPRFATEAGVTATTDPLGERRQMELVVRTMIVLLGEGYRFHHVFYGFDYGGDRAEEPSGGSGLAYNVDYPKHRWEPKHLSPKPSFAGVSAFSWLLDGTRPVIALDRFKDSRLGYVFADKKGKCTIAVWDWGGGTSEWEATTGRELTRLADIFGNETEVASPGGKLRVKLSSSPVYLIDVDPRLWGRDGSLVGKIRETPEELVDPVKVTDVRPIVSGHVPGIVVELENESGQNFAGTVFTRIRGVPEARVSAPANVPAGGRAAVRVDFTGWRPDPAERLTVDVRFSAEAVKADYRSEVGYFVAERDKPGEPALWAGGTIVAMWNAKGLFLDMTAPSNSVRMGFARMLVARRTDNGFADLVNQSAVEFTFGIGADGKPVVRRSASTFPERFPVGPVEARIRVDRAPEGFRHRLFLDWRSLGVPDPKSGGSVRVAFVAGASRLFDVDGGVRRYGELLLR